MSLTIRNHRAAITTSMKSLAIALISGAAFATQAYVVADDPFLAGYLILQTGEKVDRSYNAGFSMYIPAWPILDTYPGHRFQTGLPSTWMFAQYDGKKPDDLYSDVEGGLGWWTDTRFPTTTPKFIMGGVGPNFSTVSNGPAHGWGSWEEPRGLYGVAQLSPWVLFPLDGINVKQGAKGQMFGYGYLNLPLAEAKSKTQGKDIPTGANCWTLFFNTGNFKGPVAFFLPYFWSQAAVKEPRLAGMLLDTRPMDANMSLQMETQYIPCKVATTAAGEQYARIQPTSFPKNYGNDSILLHNFTAYKPSALFDKVDAWFKGGPKAPGKIDTANGFVRTFTGKGSATWQIRSGPAGKTQKKENIVWNNFASPKAIDPNTYGYSWTLDATQQGDASGKLTTIPEYFHLETTAGDKKPKWVPVSAASVPMETGLQSIKWTTPKEDHEGPYTTPESPASTWKVPGPVAGPYKAKLGDGSVVTYYWYRFADQPSLLNADMTQAERETMQKKVELIHRNWTKNGNYLADPKYGKLADLDPAQLVKPPKGYEIGYVPIAVKQEAAK